MVIFDGKIDQINSVNIKFVNQLKIIIISFDGVSPVNIVGIWFLNVSKISCDFQKTMIPTRNWIARNIK